MSDQRMFVSQLIVPLFGGLGIAVLAGCGDEFSTVPAGGVVMFAGAPVEGAQVMFIRDGESGPAAIGVSDAEGRFELRTGDQRGAIEGAYKVTVKKDNADALDVPDPLPEGVSRTDYMRMHNLVPSSLLPLNYASLEKTPLNLEVSASTKNDFLIQLEGQPPPAPRTRRTSSVLP